MSPSSATSTVRRISRSTAGCSGVKRGARLALPRSTASVYCTRSFVPMLKKSTSRVSVSLATAAAGVSIITPSGTSARYAHAARRRARRAASSSSARAASTSSSVTMSGSMMRRSPCIAARSSARSCVRNISGWSRHMRMARQPRNGFGFGRESADRQLVAADVEGADDDRIALERLEHATIRAVLLVLVGHARAADDEELGAHQPHALGAAARAPPRRPPGCRRSRGA